MDSVQHFEIPAEEVERAAAFYKEVFGWNIEKVPEMDYWIAYTVKVDEDRMPVEVGAINGGLFKKNKTVTSVSITLVVESIEESLKKIVRSGGKILTKKTPVGDMGFVAYFKDTEGNILGIWENVK